MCRSDDWPTSRLPYSDHDRISCLRVENLPKISCWCCRTSKATTPANETVIAREVYQQIRHFASGPQIVWSLAKCPLLAVRITVVVLLSFIRVPSSRTSPAVFNRVRNVEHSFRGHPSGRKVRVLATSRHRWCCHRTLLFYARVEFPTTSVQTAPSQVLSGFSLVRMQRLIQLIRHFLNSSAFHVSLPALVNSN